MSTTSRWLRSVDEKNANDGSSWMRDIIALFASVHHQQQQQRGKRDRELTGAALCRGARESGRNLEGETKNAVVYTLRGYGRERGGGEE
jgi:hypothetical protein